tara:strand:+ start:16150 stop:16926 length:777 start_codon:yes stop_codon:yes gene_type:complete
MSYRTDTGFQNDPSPRARSAKADNRKVLPEVTASDRLNSDKWGESLKRETGVNDMVLNQIADTHTAIVQSFRNLLDIRENQSPEVTQAAHLNHLGKMTDKAVSRLAEQATRVQHNIDKRLIDLQSEAKEALKFKQNGNAAELRGILRGMDDSERNTFISNAIESGDSEIMAAVFDGVHPLQIGMKAEHHKAIFDNALLKHSPDLFQLRKGLEKGRDLVRDTFTDLLDNSDLISARSIREQYQAESQKARDAAAKLDIA